MATISDLPTELIYHIAEHSNRSTLASLRLASRSFHAASTPSLFHTVYINPCDDPLGPGPEESYGGAGIQLYGPTSADEIGSDFDALSEDADDMDDDVDEMLSDDADDMAGEFDEMLPDEADESQTEDISDTGSSEASETTEEILASATIGRGSLPGWVRIGLHTVLRYHVRHAVLRFPNGHIVTQTLVALHFRFPPSRPTLRHHFPGLRDVSVRLWSWTGGTTAERELYGLLARALGCQAGERGGKERSGMGLVSLTASSVDPELEGIEEVLQARPGEAGGDDIDEGGTRGLERLHLSLRTAPTQDLTVAPENELRKWTGRIRKDWLQPHSQTLTHLSLYRNTYWTLHHAHDLSTVRFPNLKALALGNYCISSPNQLASILSLTTLESLLFDDCTIVFLKCVPHPQLVDTDYGPPGDWQPLTTVPTTLCRLLLTKADWASYFAQIADSLQRLRRFGFRPGNWNTGDDYGGSRRNRRQSIKRLSPLEQHDVFGIDFHRSSRYVAWDGRDHDWMEVLTQNLPDQFFRVDLDKELNYRLRERFGPLLAGDVPQVTEERCNSDMQALERLMEIVDSRARAET